MESDEKSKITIWVEEYSDYLLGFALSKISDRNLALDLVQDTFVAAIKSASNFEGRSSAKTWLTSILNRKIIDYWRQQKSRKTDVVSHYSTNSEETGDWILDKNDTAVDTVEQEIIEAEKVASLHDCMSKLPEQWQGIISAKYFEEKKGDEICNEFEVTPSNMWVIVHRAKSALRDCLGQNWF
ncbi:MAG: RNA polymerase sigma factor [Lishizhenia sp.]